MKDPAHIGEIVDFVQYTGDKATDMHFKAVVMRVRGGAAELVDLLVYGKFPPKDADMGVAVSVPFSAAGEPRSWHPACPEKAEG